MLVVEGRFSLQDGCRTLRGMVEEQPGALLLNVVAGRPRADCPRIPAEYDYEVRIGPLARGSFQLTVVKRTEERLGWPAPIALRVDLRVD